MRSALSVSAAVVLLATTARAFVQGPPTCMTAGGREGPARARARTRTNIAHVLPRSRSVSPLFVREDPAAAPAEPVAIAEIEATTPTAEEGTEEEPKPMSELEIAQMEKRAEIERLRSKEVFITEKTGVYECTQCAFMYMPNEGGQGALQGTEFEDLPSTWLCPVCKSPKESFRAQTKTIAGFEDNLKYGFGNNLTGSQKSLLIFGSLGALFLLFLAGYALD